MSENNNIPKVSDEFKDMVRKWLKCDDDIKEYNKKNKEIKNKKKEYEKFILEYMEKINLPALGSQDGTTLKRNVSKVKSSLKKEILHKALTEYTKDVQKAQTITNFILDKRPTVEKVYLKRTGKRKPINV
jgi:vacuolar-type H+-ATPase subunit I/STV1